MKSNLIVVGSLLLAGVFTFAGQEKQQEPAKPEDAVKKLQKERLTILKERLEITRKLFANAAAAADELRFWEEQVIVAEAEFNGKTEDLRNIYERIVAGIKEREKLAERANKSGAFTRTEQLELKAIRLSFEIKLAQLPAK